MIREIKNIVDSAMSQPNGYVDMDADMIENALEEFERRGVRAFYVNGENYSPESLEQLVRMSEIQLQNLTEPFVIGADIQEPWIREQIDRLVPYAGKDGFFLVVG